MPDRIFGEIPGIPPGTVFANRENLSRAGVHRPPRAGISGAQDEGADSIVLSGGYEDDRDYGDLILYTGKGGQDPVSRKQVADQQLTHQNRALVVSRDRGLPVRVVRGHTHRSSFSPSTGYRYEGLYNVESYWQETGASGFKVWRFRFIRRPGEGSKDPGPPRLILPSGNTIPERIQSALHRIIRDTALSGTIKILYDFHCQICGIRLVGPTGPYAEAAHVRPLGKPHNGPDTADNLLCLCPNHHYLFDVGAFGIRANLTLIGLPGRLRLHPQHALNPEHLQYHQNYFELLNDS